MKITDRLCRVRGMVRAAFVRVRALGSPVKDASYPHLSVHNTLSYAAADAMAAAYGGDTSRVPRYIGFIYGTEEAPALPPIDRDMTMDSVRSLVESIGNANMQVCRFSRKPTVGDYDTFGVQPGPVCPEDSNDSNDSNDLNDSAESEKRYFGNVVEFHAMTNTGVDGDYAFETYAGGPFAGELTDGMAIYRAVLLGDGKNPCVDPYTVLAMVDLKKNGVYRQKPESYELALDWRVMFE